METKKSTKIIPILILSIIFIGLYSLKDNFNFSAKTPNSVNKGALERLEELTKEMNDKLLPRIIDEDTSFDKTYVSGNMMVGVLTLSDEVVAVGKEEVAKFVKENLFKEYCTHTANTFKFLREYRIGLKRQYYSKAGDLVTESTVTIKDCPKENT